MFSMFSPQYGLHDDVMMHLFRFFPRSDLNTLAQIDKRFNQLTSDHSLHKRHHFPLPNYLEAKEKSIIHSTQHIGLPEARICHALLTYYGEKLFLVYEPFGICISDLNKTTNTLFSIEIKVTAICAISETEIITGHDDGCIRCWNTKDETFSILYEDKFPITHLVKRNDDEIIFTSRIENDDRLNKFNIRTKTCDSLFQACSAFALYKITGNILLYATEMQAYLFDFQSNKFFQEITLTNAKITLLSENKFVIYSHWNIRIYCKKQNANEYELINLINLGKLGFGAKISWVTALSEDSFAVAMHKTLMVFKLNGNERFHLEAIQTANTSINIEAMTLLPDKTKLAVTTNFDGLQIFDLQQRNVTQILNPDLLSKLSKCAEKLIVTENNDVIFIKEGNCLNITFSEKNVLIENEQPRSRHSI